MTMSCLIFLIVCRCFVNNFRKNINYVTLYDMHALIGTVAVSLIYIPF